MTIALTGAAFWLSYEHLAEVASHNGLEDDRGWAWPATIDLFIVIGELLVLRASLQGERDWYAISITAGGSLASIGINLAGVGENASRLEYIVAGVPPVAALLAFGALMRQVHKALRHHAVLQPVVTDRQPLPETPVVDLEAPEVLERTVETEVPVLEEAGEPQVSALEAPSTDQETLVEKLVAGGEPLPGRKTVAEMYGVSDWTARQALAEAKRRLQESLQTATVAKEN
jgi:hypothetical protein